MSLFLKERVQRHSFALQVSNTFFFQVLTAIFSVANSVIIARWLGPGGKGAAALLVLLPNLFALVGNGGVGVANIYFAGSRRADASALTQNSVTFALLSTALSTALMLILLATGLLQSLVPGVSLWLIVLAMFAVPGKILSGYFSAILQGLLRILPANLVNGINGLSALVLTWLLVVGCGLEVLGAVLGFVVASLATTVAAAVLLRQHEPVLFRPKCDLPLMRNTLSFGLRGHVGNLLQFFNYRLDLFIVNYFLGSAAVGIYSASVAIAEVLWLLPGSVGFVISAKAAGTQPAIMNKFTPTVFKVTTALTFLGAIVLGICGRSIIRILFSPSFSEAYFPLLVLLPGVVLLGGSKVLSNEITGRGYPQFNSIVAGATLLVTILLDLILIPRYGVLGASLASTIAYAASLPLTVAFYLHASRRGMGRWPSQTEDLWRPDSRSTEARVSLRR